MYLVLKFGFEDMQAQRIIIKGDVRNKASVNAAKMLGCKHEAIVRSDYIMSDGHRRDSFQASILDYEWPLIKTRLEIGLTLPSNTRSKL